LSAEIPLGFSKGLIGVLDCHFPPKGETSPMTIAALERQALALPAASRVRLAEKILASITEFTTPGIKKAWEAELASRAKEIKEGGAEGIPAEQVSAAARRKVNEARRLSSARRK
jgi:putative addiction module component (TIGR02574 family)